MACNYDEESVQAVIQWTETTQLPKEVILSEAERIIDTAIYVRANINDIKQHYPDAFYNPSITRLYKLNEFVVKAAQQAAFFHLPALGITEVSYSFYPDTGNKSPFHGNLSRQTGNKTHFPGNYEHE